MHQTQVGSHQHEGLCSEAVRLQSIHEQHLHRQNWNKWNCAPQVMLAPVTHQALIQNTPGSAADRVDPCYVHTCIDKHWYVHILSIRHLGVWFLFKSGIYLGSIHYSLEAWPSSVKWCSLACSSLRGALLVSNKGRSHLEGGGISSHLRNRGQAITQCA